MRVVKDIVEPPQEHLMYGTAVHKVAEEYIRDDTPIPEKFAYIKTINQSRTNFLGCSRLSASVLQD